MIGSQERIDKNKVQQAITSMLQYVCLSQEWQTQSFGMLTRAAKLMKVAVCIWHKDTGTFVGNSSTPYIAQSFVFWWFGVLTPRLHQAIKQIFFSCAMRHFRRFPSIWLCPYAGQLYFSSFTPEKTNWEFWGNHLLLSQPSNRKSAPFPRCQVRCGAMNTLRCRIPQRQELGEIHRPQHVDRVGDDGSWKWWVMVNHDK